MYGRRPIRFLRTLVCGLFKIPGFSGRRYFKRQKFNHTLRLYRQLRRLFSKKKLCCCVLKSGRVKYKDLLHIIEGDKN